MDARQGQERIGTVHPKDGRTARPRHVLLMTQKKPYRFPGPSKTYFFWDGSLHKAMYIDRPRNLVTAWRYDINSQVEMLYTDWKKRREPAFRTGTVAKFFGLSRLPIQRAIDSNSIIPPQRTYP